MIPVQRQNEPHNFDELVRTPGTEFLLGNPNPTEEQWRKKAYWQRALPTMRFSYNEICSYCATWIPHSTGTHSIDHFVPKSQNPSLAYEWNNFRYCSSRFNSRKGLSEIVDPFVMELQWFTIDFSTFFINPNTVALDVEQIQLASNTIEILKLNDDEELVNERSQYVKDYKAGEISYDYLERRAPFIASELNRQNLLV